MNSFTYSFRLCLIVLAIFITSSAIAQNQVRITLHQPPPNQLSAGDLWKMTLENTTGSPLEIYLDGYGEEQNEGRIVDGTSPVFTLPVGRTNYNYENFKSGNVSWKNSKFEEFIIRTGQVPAGTYTTCVSAYSSDGMLVGMEKCITQIISRRFEGEITLISPGDGENTDTSTPFTFAWTPLPGGGSYKIKIVEVIGDQSPEVAMLRNKAFFEKEDIRMTSFQYPSSAPKFDEGKKYAWVIISGELQSEPGIFRRGTTGMESSIFDRWGVLSNDKSNVAFSWKSDYYVERMDILKYLRTKELIIKKGVYLYDYSKNPYGDIKLTLARPIIDNGVEKKGLLFEVDCSDVTCKVDGEECMGNPGYRENPSFCEINPTVENGFITEITLSYKNTSENPSDPVVSEYSIVCINQHGWKCFAYRKSCIEFQWDYVNSPFFGWESLYGITGVSCRQMISINDKTNIELLRIKNSSAYIKINDESIPIVSDVAEEFLESFQNPDKKMSEEDIKYFLENIIGPVSSERLTQMSRELGLPIIEQQTIPTGVDYNQNNIQGITITITITCDIARSKFDCLIGGGLCNCTIGFLSVGNDNNTRKRTMSVSITGNVLNVRFKDELPDDATLFIFDEPTLIDNSIAKELGYKQITLLPGSYKVENEGGDFFVKLNIKKE